MEKEHSNPEEQADKYRLHYFHLKNVPELTADELEEESGLIYNNLMQDQVRPSKTKLMWRPVAVAAAVAIVIGGLVFYQYNGAEQIKTHQKLVSVVSKNDADPGKTNATLLLANGTNISLQNVAAGKVAEQAGVTISKSKDNVLIYTPNNTVVGDMQFNTISTSRGQEYCIMLPDGSKVWLNAASSLKYPASFVATKTRTVQLNGEAYFEIAKDKNQPFIVKTANQEIEVLGTHFNVSSYPDELSAKTTLIEGAVQIRGTRQVMLKPGQQAISTRNSINVSTANVAESVAWKNGDFLFENENLPSVLRQVSRWYDVEIVDSTGHDKLHLTGSVSRNKKLSTVLKALGTITKLKFDIKDQQVIVTE